MKKYLMMIFCVISMNCFAAEFEVILKQYAQGRIIELGKNNRKILDVKPLDTERSGYVVISYQ